MPHFPKPYFKANRRTWYVEANRKQHVLGRHPKGEPFPAKGKDGNWNPPPEIWQAYHAIMATLPEEPSDESAPQAHHPFVRSIIDSYMDWLKKRVQAGDKAQRTYDWYHSYLLSFLKFASATLTIDELQPQHVYQWVDSHEGWRTSKRSAMISVQRAFTWAAKAGLLKSIGGRSPLYGLEKPAQGRREQLISVEEYRQILDLVKDPTFRDLVELAWETGTRPQELFTVEASYVDLANARWVFPVRMSKGKKVQRVVYLTDIALAITQRLLRERTTGKLLVNNDGEPWCGSSVKCRFQRLCMALGRQRVLNLGLMPPRLPRLTKMQTQDPQLRKQHQKAVDDRTKQVRELCRAHGTMYSLYSFRHAFCTQALESGKIDAVTVSILMGHRDTTMISRHYSHLTQRVEHLRDAARKARGA